MRVVHSLGPEKISKNVNSDVGFLLSNKQGAYLSLSAEPLSRYQGWFVPFEGKVFRVLENIAPVQSPPVTEVRNNFWNVDRKRDYLYESFVVPDYDQSCLIYELSESSEIEITLDIKDAYQDSEFGRYYKISEEKKTIVVRFYQENEFEFYLAIKSDQLNYQQVNQWLERQYLLDKQRNSPPYARFVYQALRLKAKKIVLCFDPDKDKAIKHARLIYNRVTMMKHLEIERVNKLLPTLDQIKDKELKMAYLCALNSLYSLTVFHDKKPGIYAGLPWFFQFWTRDEAISLKALASIDERQASDLLNKLIVSIGSDGRIISKEANNADGVGWAFKRAGDLLAKKSSLKREKENIIKFLDKSLTGLLANYTQEQLATNKSRETWMDTLSRKGERLEIQALRANMYQLAFKLTRDDKYIKLRNKLVRKVRSEFWKNNNIVDGLKDKTIRPNIFLAAYLYPNLFKKNQWLKGFEKSLLKLWLDWGGLASIDKSSASFCDVHTGQNPKSYHSGDSWYWVNNLTALVLYKFGQRKFSNQIKKILQASTQEILWQGVAGHHAELSSAYEQKSEGCWAQAWSAALYIELVQKILRI